MFGVHAVLPRTSESAPMCRLESAPVRELFETYAGRLRSRGELGVLSSLHQPLWLEHRELQDFLARSARDE